MMTLRNYLLNDKPISDVRVLFATTTNQFDSLYSFVRDMYKDIFTVSLNSVGTGVDTAMAPILQRIQSSKFVFILLVTAAYISLNSVLDKLKKYFQSYPT